jgi:D-alanyl-D-alanine dipeptidase
VNADFGFVDEWVPGIRWDAKYATWDNFTGKPVDGYLSNRIVGSAALCTALERAQEKAASQGFGLLLWDGYRPQQAVDHFLRWAAEPEDGRTKRRHYPNISRAQMFEQGYVAARSGHSRGSTVDLTLYHLDGRELAAMGGHHDLMDPISHHGARGITREAARNRECLASIMESCGFHRYDREWWHYTLRDEPYPDIYFDFAVASSSEATARLAATAPSARPAGAGSGPVRPAPRRSTTKALPEAPTGSRWPRAQLRARQA